MVVAFVIDDDTSALQMSYGRGAVRCILVAPIVVFCEMTSVRAFWKYDVNNSKTEQMCGQAAIIGVT